jgi:peroxiredoxin
VEEMLGQLGSKGMNLLVVSEDIKFLVVRLCLPAGFDRLLLLSEHFGNGALLSYTSGVKNDRFLPR